MRLKSGKQSNAYSGSIIEPSDPYARQVWEQRRRQAARAAKIAKQPKQSKNWFVLAIIAFVVLIIVPLFIAAIIAKNKPSETPAEEIQDPEISDEEDLAEYFYELTSDPDYIALFDSAVSRYSNPPANVTCDSLKEITKMNADMLNLYLDRGYVVAFVDGNHSFLVYNGTLDLYTYHAIPINCPSTIDTSSSRLTYDANGIFDNLSSKARYYVWIDPKDLNQDDEDF